MCEKKHKKSQTVIEKSFKWIFDLDFHVHHIHTFFLKKFKLSILNVFGDRNHNPHNNPKEEEKNSAQ